ncbi:MAG: gamma-glutamylcyclotransferase, partial [Selenomonas sp.]|nr:gamma-glutamylcyclotransferase [Selenomonas sp.]
VPCYIWSITEADEKSLDRYEGYPTFYYKKTLPVELIDGGTIEGMAYIMHEERELGIPYANYFNNMREVYAIENWDDKILWDALDKSTDHIKSVAKKH